MMNINLTRLFRLFLTAGLISLSSCGKDNPDPGPIWPDDPDDTPGEVVDKPGECGNIVVAHRGGSTEAGISFPDNSIASLQYAMSLKCYASECDIYWTKDNKVVVAHADSDYRINGLHPWEATLEEIRAAGRLANGETIPDLEMFLDEVMKKGSCTKLWLDIKNISGMSAYPINAAKRACEIIKEKKAKNFVEFICTSNATVMSSSYSSAVAVGANIAWMANKSASAYRQSGYKWANLSTEFMKQGGGSLTIEEFNKEGIDVSVFNADDDVTMNYYISYAPKMKAICTNYPKKLSSKMGK